MKRSIVGLTVGIAAVAPVAGLMHPAWGILNEFSLADGYSGAFSTRVWTYHPLWSFDGGSIGNNYVAQHGYGSGFPYSEPFGLVIRNDAPPSAYAFSYQFEPADLAGINPANPAGHVITMTFDHMGTYGGGGTVGVPMFVMAFGGTRANPGFRIGWSSNARMMYSDPNNNLIESSVPGVPTQWTRIFLQMDFVNYTYDLAVGSMTGSWSNASNTWTVTTLTPVVTGMPFANITTMQNLWFDVFPDVSGGGWHKNFLDHFTAVPTPGTVVLLLTGLAARMCRRRSG